MIATPEKLEIYKQFDSVPVIIEGPEYCLDLTYFLVHNFEDLRNLEQGISVENLASDVAENKERHLMEFRVLQKMTQHKDHISNLFVSSDVNF